MEKKTLVIAREKFLNWYIDGSEDFMSEAFDCLLEFGTYTLTIEDLLSRAEYIPEHILVEGQEYSLDENDDVDTSNAELIFN